jgi:uncharacterized NAD-dependent epimerase/dehydratase family protein
MRTLDGNAIVYCQGAYRTPTGKTAHGLVRRTARYRVLSVIDSTCAGADAGTLLGGEAVGIPVVASLGDAMRSAQRQGMPATHFVIGLAPDGGRLTAGDREAVRDALLAGLHVDSGLHDFLSDDPELAAIAQAGNLRIRDVRRTPPRSRLHPFTGRIAEVGSLRVAVLGTDSAVGKRTTAWLLKAAFEAAGRSCEVIGTGQTAWMQGVEYGIILDSLVNDFVAGELENAVVTAWRDRRPDVIVIEGQGSLMNPAYPGGLEILAATRPQAIVLQHAPTRTHYDGFPDEAIHPLTLQIAALELVSGRKVTAIALNSEGVAPDQIGEVADRLARETGIPVAEPIRQGAGALVQALISGR